MTKTDQKLSPKLPHVLNSIVPSYRKVFVSYYIVPIRVYECFDNSRT